MLGFCQLHEQPLHLILFEWHIDFDRGVARNRRRNTRPHRFQVDGLVLACELFEDFVHHVLDLRRVDARRCDLYRHAARAEGLRFKTIAR